MIQTKFSRWTNRALLTHPLIEQMRTQIQPVITDPAKAKVSDDITLMHLMEECFQRLHLLPPNDT